MYTAPKAELIKLALAVSTSNGGNTPAEEEPAILDAANFCL